MSRPKPQDDPQMIRWEGMGHTASDAGMSDTVTVPRRQWEEMQALAAIASAMLEVARPLVLTKLRMEAAEYMKFEEANS